MTPAADQRLDRIDRRPEPSTKTTDQSTNVFWLALPSMGEAWHHNHHAFPRSAFHGLRRRELDPAGWVIVAMEKLGLVWNVVRIAPERQAQKISV